MAWAFAKVGRSDDLLFVVLATPLSLNIEEFAIGGVGMFLPTEPLMFGVMIIFFLRLLYERKFDYRIIQHPITLSILFYLFWVWGGVWGWA